LWALIAYWRAFFSEEETFARGPAKSALTAVLAAHTTLLVFLALRFHRFPLGSLGEALLFLGWILALLHLLSEWSADTRRLGLFTLSPAAACALPSIFLLSRELGVPAYRGTLFIFHIVASLASYAAFSLAAVLAALYLTQHRNLKQKRFDLTFRKLPPLDKLDRLAATWAFLGTLLMIVSSVIGVWWVQRDDLSGMSIYEAGPRASRARLARPAARAVAAGGLRRARRLQPLAARADPLLEDPE
jgi:HemX protein